MAEGDQSSDTKRDPIRVQLEGALRFLSAEQVSLIDEALAGVSPFGEVTLRVQGGQLSTVDKTKSYDALKLQRPGGRGR